MTAYVGIDPGLKGYIATFYENGEYALTPMPCVGSLLDARAITGHSFLLPEDSVIVVEQQFAKGRGGKTVLTNYGALLSALRLAGHAPDTVSARKWKGYFNLLREPDETDREYKERSIRKVKELVPDVWHEDMTHDAAEAVLLALYAEEVVQKPT